MIDKTVNVNYEMEHYIAENTTAMLAYLDATLKYKYVNTAYAQLFGKTREEIIDSMSPKELLNADEFNQSNAHIEAALCGESRTFQRETRIPDKEKRYYLVNYKPDSKLGRINGIQATITDITPAKQYDSELLTNYEIAQKLNTQLASFTHIVSHNLKSHTRNLTTAINLFVNATGENERNKTLELLKEVSNGICTIVTNAGEIARVQTNSGLPVEHIVLADYLDRSIKLLSLQIEESSAVIVNSIPHDLAIEANPAYVDSIMQNLLSNAIKYHHPDRAPLIEISCNITDDIVTLLFKDNGSGIDLTKYGSKIFGAFQTFHRSPEAVGLGLFITKYQAEAMGGSVEIESEPGIGSLFKVHLKKH